MKEITDEEINAALKRIDKAKNIDIDSENKDERIGQLMILCIQEGFREASNRSSLKDYSKGWESGKKDTLSSWDNFMLRLKTKIDLLPHNCATLETCLKEDVEKLIDKLAPSYQNLTGDLKT